MLWGCPFAWPGLIPAHAGKTFAVGVSIRLAGAHPRSRGENEVSVRRCASGEGSSPLTRGKLRCRELKFIPERLIPAHAGKTRLRACHPGASGAHPRSRGENIAVSFRLSAGAGSSPLTRGKLAPGACAPGDWGLIPAHAGKTCRVGHAGPPIRAHPRSRGENSARPPPSASGHGSSPLTRGKRVPPQRDGEAERLIPAHAGKTYCQDCQARFLPAHPRSRGENYMGYALGVRLPGSSPLTRGKHA